MKLSHAPAALSASFDEPSLVVSSGLVPAVALAEQVGLPELVADRLTVPRQDRNCAGAYPELKVMSLVAGMLAGADSIDDMDVLRHGAMGRLFAGMRAPSTLGTFLRAFTFGHVRQLDAVAAGVLAGLCRRAPLLPDAGSACFIDIDDTIDRVYGAGKQGAQFGYTRVRGLNAQLATLTTPGSAPVIAATRLRRGAAASGHGAVRMITDAVATARRCGVAGPVTVRADSAYCSAAVITAVRKAGARFSVAMRLQPSVRTAIASIEDAAWTRIDYPQAIPDPDTGELVSAAEVAEIEYTAFTSKAKRHHVTARLIVRRIPELNAAKLAGQDPLFPLWRYHAVFTDSPEPLVDAEAQYRGHAIIEQVFADLKASALAHLPSGKFTANAAWLVCAAIAFNLTRAVGVLAGGTFAKAEGATVRARLINIPCRVTRSARRIRLRLPSNWLWATSWMTAWNATVCRATV